MINTELINAERLSQALTEQLTESLADSLYLKSFVFVDEYLEHSSPRIKVGLTCPDFVNLYVNEGTGEEKVSSYIEQGIKDIAKGIGQTIDREIIKEMLTSEELPLSKEDFLSKASSVNFDIIHMNVNTFAQFDLTEKEMADKTGKIIKISSHTYNLKDEGKVNYLPDNKILLHKYDDKAEFMFYNAAESFIPTPTPCYFTTSDNKITLVGLCIGKPKVDKVRVVTV